MIQLRTQPRPPPPLSPQVLIEPKTSLSEEEGRDPQESDKGGLAVEENSHPEEKISEEVIETTDAKVILHNYYNNSTVLLLGERTTITRCTSQCIKRKRHWKQWICNN